VNTVSAMQIDIWAGQVALGAMVLVLVGALWLWFAPGPGPLQKKLPGFLLPFVCSVLVAAIFAKVWARSSDAALAPQVDQWATALAVAALVLLFVRILRLFFARGDRTQA
jgi:hypothetical protein